MDRFFIGKTIDLYNIISIYSTIKGYIEIIYTLLFKIYISLVNTI